MVQNKSIDLINSIIWLSELDHSVTVGQLAQVNHPAALLEDRIEQRILMFQSTHLVAVLELIVGIDAERAGLASIVGHILADPKVLDQVGQLLFA